MSDEAKLDRLIEHVLDLKESMARIEGADLPKRVAKLEDAVHEGDKRWARLAGVSTIAGILGGGFVGALAKKLGLTP